MRKRLCQSPADGKTKGIQSDKVENPQPRGTCVRFHGRRDARTDRADNRLVESVREYIYDMLDLQHVQNGTNIQTRYKLTVKCKRKQKKQEKRAIYNEDIHINCNFAKSIFGQNGSSRFAVLSENQRKVKFQNLPKIFNNQLFIGIFKVGLKKIGHGKYQSANLCKKWIENEW